MELLALPFDFSICQVASTESINLNDDFTFASKTDEELSLVCQTKKIPASATKRDDGWRAFRIQGQLDFSLVGILASISTILANAQIGIFAISTFNTDYILVKQADFSRALDALSAEGYRVIS